MGQESLTSFWPTKEKVNETKPKNHDNVIVANTRKPVDNKIAPNNKKTRSQNQRIQTRKNQPQQNQQ
jgi:hypothetical protein